MSKSFCYYSRAFLAGLLLSLPFLSLAQKNISGKVVSAKDHVPIPGVSVQIKGARTGTATDAEGNFILNAKTGDILLLSGIDIKGKEVPVTDGSYMSIELEQTTKAMNEVVVTALGIKKEVKKLGYAVQEVKGEDLVKARDQNPITGLIGKVAGLSVGPSAELLRKPTVLLRGNEITLYVVDGIPISSDTWNISPDDIESYSVLKGPTAAALYGSRAQFGAILITTKKASKLRKGFTVEVNSSNVTDKGFLAFPRLQDDYGPGENGLYRFGDGKGGGLNDNDYDVWGPKFEGQLLPQYDSPVDPVTGVRQGTPFIARGKNNLKRFLRTGFQTTNNIALSAAGENYNLRFSLSHSYQQSMIPNMQLNITNFNMYGSYNPTRRLKIEANMNFNRQYTPNFPDVDYGPNSLLYNVAIWTGADWDVSAPDIRGIWQKGKVGTQSVFAEYQRYHNPWFMAYEWLRGHYKSDIYGYVTANYQLDNHLNLIGRTQVTTYNLLRTEKMPYSAHPYGREQNMGDYREDRRNLFENNTELQVTYNYNIARFFNLSGIVGGNIRSFSYNSSFTSTDYLTVPGVFAFSNSLNPLQASSFTSDMRVLSGYYSVDLSFGKYATLSTTGRVDKTSTLRTNNAPFYPSISASSVLSDYIPLPNVISFLKVRGSYADVRSDATSAEIGMAPFSTISAYGNTPSGVSLFDYPLDYGNNYHSPYGGPNYSLIPVYSTPKVYNNQPAAYGPTDLYASVIKTFKRENYEAGVDLRFFKNRLGLSVTGFKYIDGPLILSNPISTATGSNSLVLNALTTVKKGYEVILNGTPVKGKNISWDVLVNWSTYQDKYKEIPPGQPNYRTFFVNGDRVDKLYTSAFVKTSDGKVVHDGAGKPLSNPVPQFLGYLNADYQWSIYNKVAWKEFSVGFQFDGSVGGVISDYMHNKTMRGGRNLETAEGKLGAARYDDYKNATNPAFKGSYVGDGAVVSNGTPINFDSKTGAILNYKDLQFAPNKTATHVQDYVSKYYGIGESNLMSKTYAKLREVTIGYELPQRWLNKSFIAKASISLVGRNLLYFYGDKRFKDVDLDQYNYSTSGTVLQSPTTRRYGFNINVVF